MEPLERWSGTAGEKSHSVGATLQTYRLSCGSRACPQNAVLGLCGRDPFTASGNRGYTVTVDRTHAPMESPRLMFNYVDFVGHVSLARERWLAMRAAVNLRGTHCTTFSAFEHRSMTTRTHHRVRWVCGICGA